jgi:hypothetical protein
MTKIHTTSTDVVLTNERFRVRAALDTNSSGLYAVRGGGRTKYYRSTRAQITEAMARVNAPAKVEHGPFCFCTECLSR